MKKYAIFLTLALVPIVSMADRYTHSYLRSNGTYVSGYHSTDSNSTRIALMPVARRRNMRESERKAPSPANRWPTPPALGLSAETDQSRVPSAESLAESGWTPAVTVYRVRS